MQVRVEVVRALEQEDPALAGRVGGLQHGRVADRLGRDARLVQRARGREARLRHARVGQPVAHRDLVRHRVRRLRADPGQAERLCDGGDDRHGAVGRERQHAVDRVAAPDLDHGVDVGEVDDLADVRVREPRRVRIPVDRDDAVAELLHAQEAAALVPAAADEEERGHGRRCYSAGASGFS